MIACTDCRFHDDGLWQQLQPPFRHESGSGNRLRGSCKTTNKDIAARQVAEIETREWKCSFDGPQAVLRFAQAASLYRAAGKSGRYLAPIEDYLRRP
jgi:hypothetical protein